MSCIQGRTSKARKGRLGFRGVTPSPAQKTAGPAQTPSFAPGAGGLQVASSKALPDPKEPLSWVDHRLGRHCSRSSNR